ncbi:hypothetical protein KA005_10170, partial [bacterium]|nr:hypothetical protein [bacterium]
MKIKGYASSLIPIGGFFLCWQLFAHFGFINIALFPPPTKIFTELAALFHQEIAGHSVLLTHLIFTLK